MVLDWYLIGLDCDWYLIGTCLGLGGLDWTHIMIGRGGGRTIVFTDPARTISNDSVSERLRSITRNHVPLDSARAGSSPSPFV